MDNKSNFQSVTNVRTKLYTTSNRFTNPVDNYMCKAAKIISARQWASRAWHPPLGAGEGRLIEKINIHVLGVAGPPPAARKAHEGSTLDFLPLRRGFHGISPNPPGIEPVIEFPKLLKQPGQGA